MPLMALTLLTVVSGLYIRFSESWILLYKYNLFFHPAIGVCWAVGIWLHHRSTRKRGDRRLLWAMLVLCVIGIAVSIPATHIAPFYFPIALCTALVIWKILKNSKRAILGQKAVRDTVQLLFMYGVLLVSATGILIFLKQLGPIPPALFTLHTIGAVGLIILLRRYSNSSPHARESSENP